jgi:hypothetical protein
LPHWRFRTPEVALASAQAIFGLYQAYKARGDFVGMDMARKFLQMGYTRARRYANHRGGRKYQGSVPPERRGQSGAWGRAVRPLEPDLAKAEAARIFYRFYQQVLQDPQYQRRKADHLERFERPAMRADRPKETAP